MIDSRDKERIADSMSMLIRTFLVAGRAGQPAEGRLPFNPLNFQLLRHLLQHEVGRVSDLADFFGIPKTTLFSAAAALEKRGLIEKAPDPDDGRARVMTLTDEGRETAEAIRRQDLMNAGVILALLPEDRVAAYTDDMELLTERLAALLGDQAPK
ncbi:MarR family transcriptional regulator [Parvularcula sp. ZS-1/3]|uniref:MarR family transcriptional regulator n=1 Tax=Parvularcula mediterranea TaxID=2732508 RepID=A0A7Y3RP70_9PROT|nr:MarR family transcriptional regulator [Parvularcula mediterranea]NNU17704.1 MarR family transcriptional regulator [Parvularcula mediterranea]